MATAIMVLATITARELIVQIATLKNGYKQIAIMPDPLLIIAIVIAIAEEIAIMVKNGLGGDLNPSYSKNSIRKRSQNEISNHSRKKFFRQKKFLL
jgi:hypothetical protein